MKRGAWVVAAGVLLAGCSSVQSTARITEGDARAVAPPVQRSGEPTGSHEILADLCADYCDYLLATAENDCPEPEANVALCVDYLDRIRLVAVAVSSRLDRHPGLARTQVELQDSARSVLDQHAAFRQQECPLVVQERTAEDAACAEQAELIREQAGEVGRLLVEATRTAESAAVSG